MLKKQVNHIGAWLDDWIFFSEWTQRAFSSETYNTNQQLFFSIFSTVKGYQALIKVYWIK